MATGTTGDMSRSSPLWNFFWRKKSDNQTKTTGRYRNRRLDGGCQAHAELLRGLYHGTREGLQFASPLTLPPIQSLVNLMGTPQPNSESELVQDYLDRIVKQYSSQFDKIHIESLLMGTAWIYPHFDKTRGLIWTMIPDEYVSDIYQDANTGLIKSIMTTESIQYKSRDWDGFNGWTCRKVEYTPEWVHTAWNVTNIEGRRVKNVTGLLPISFRNEEDETGCRGISLFSRVIRDLKDYHDIDYSVSELLGTFKAKQIQTVRDLAAWNSNNFGESHAQDGFAIADFWGMDAIVNVEGETTDYIWLPSDATASHEAALQRKFLKIIEGTGIPEILWGPLAVGNHATTQEQWQQAVMRAKAMQLQYSESYLDLMRSSVYLLALSEGRQLNLAELNSEIEIKWDDIDTNTEVAKAQIFSQTASGIVSLSSAGLITERMVYEKLKTLWMGLEMGTYEEFVRGTEDMITKQMQNKSQNYYDRLDEYDAHGGPSPITTNENPFLKDEEDK
jgi:hypothetical protein